MRMLDLIIKKRSGLELAQAEFDYIAKGASSGVIPDYQLASWLMACYFNPLSDKETAFLTKAMAFSGKRMDLGGLRLPKVDKHSTGGVGDGISLALAPLVACAGVAVPMMSGRGLGHTGGTLDKLESVKGFKVRLAPAHIKRQMKSIGVCMMGQTGELAPADKKLYSLRDASGTVESRPLIVASILSKKYAEGIDALVMDVKYGSGAFLIDYGESRKLAQALVNTAKLLGIRTVALLTAMDQPLGRVAGNAMEMEQSIRVLQGDKSAPDFVELMFELGAWMVFMGKKAKSHAHARELLERALSSGRALDKMRDMIRWQGGDARVTETPGKFLPRARLVSEIKAGSSGYVGAIEARQTGFACVALGAGRNSMEDRIDFGAGIEFEKKVGDKVRAGEVIARLYSSDAGKLSDGACKMRAAIKVSPVPAKPPVLIKEIIK